MLVVWAQQNRNSMVNTQGGAISMSGASIKLDESMVGPNSQVALQSTILCILTSLDARRCSCISLCGSLGSC